MLAWQELRHHPSRLGGVLLAIVISVGFISAALVFVSTESSAIGKSATAPTSGADVLVGLPIEPEQAARAQQVIADIDGVQLVEPIFRTFASTEAANGTGSIDVNSLSADPRLRWSELESGRWPDRTGEIALSTQAAEHLGLQLGDQLEVIGYAEKPVPLPVIVVGLSTTERSLFGNVQDSGFMTVADLQAHPGIGGTPEFLVIAESGVTPTDLARRIDGALAGSPFAQDRQVQTSAEAAAAMVAALAGGVDVFRNLLLVFGAIALLVGTIMIANTFTILVAQRRRQIALLRAVGASTGQVRQTFLIEALVVGAVGSLVGVGFGIGIATIASAWSGSLTWGLAVPVVQLVATVAVGLVITLLAALVPSAQAMRVKPLEALRPMSGTDAKRAAVARGVVSLVLVAIGVGLAVLSLAGAAGPQGLVLAVGGAMALSLGILLAAPFFVPPLLALVGTVVGAFGPTSRLAATNSVRNPGRAAATCTALMLAVGLIVTLQVGAASMTASMTKVLDEQYPVDVMVTDYSGRGIPESVQRDVAAVTGVAVAEPIATTDVGERGGPGLTLAGLTQDTQVVTGGLDQLDDQHVLVSGWAAQAYGLKDGSSITLNGAQSDATLIVAISRAATDSTGLVTPATLARLDPKAQTSSLWLSVEDRGASASVLADLERIVGTDQNLNLSGSVTEGAVIEQIVGVLLLIATGLLAVAVLIALIGVGNTLGLSVLERTRESALLRALGLQRGQLRAMLAVEAVMLAVVAAVVGVVAGIGFGYLGTAAAIGLISDAGAVFRISVPQTLAVVGIAVLAGLLASVLPARRAVRSTPVEALAEV